MLEILIKTKLFYLYSLMIMLGIKHPSSEELTNFNTLASTYGGKIERFASIDAKDTVYMLTTSETSPKAEYSKYIYSIAYLNNYGKSITLRKADSVQLLDKANGALANFNLVVYYDTNTVKRVEFTLSGTGYTTYKKTETIFPAALYGDSDSKYLYSATTTALANIYTLNVVLKDKNLKVLETKNFTIKYGTTAEVQAAYGDFPVKVLYSDKMVMLRQIEYNKYLITRSVDVASLPFYQKL